MVGPPAVATTVGKDRPAVPLAVPFVLGLNGNAVTFSARLAAETGLTDALGDPVRIGAALKRVADARVAAGKPLRFGVVHRYSSHNYMLRYWLAGVGVRPDQDIEIIVTSPPFAPDALAAGEGLKGVGAGRVAGGKPLRFGGVRRYSSHNDMLRYWLAGVVVRPDQDIEIIVTSPPFAADALAAGEVDGICVGEPWNSIAVDRGVGHIALATAQIWRRGVEKVLAMRETVLDERRGAVEALVRALHAAAAHFVEPGAAEESADILARPEYRSEEHTSELQ